MRIIKLFLPLAAAGGLAASEPARAQSTWRDVAAVIIPQSGSALPPAEYASRRPGDCPVSIGRELILVSGPDAGHDGVLSLAYRDSLGEIRTSRVVGPTHPDTVSVEVLHGSCNRRPAGELMWMLLDLHGAALIYEGPGYSFFRTQLPDGSLSRLVYDTELRQTLAESQVAETKKAATRRALADRLAALRARGWSQRAVDAILKETIYIGMTSDMVRESWGTPDDINRTTTAAGVREQWVYGWESFVYFEGGIVVIIQN